MYILARAWANVVPGEIYLSLACVVWVIYVLDRIFDSWKADKRGLLETLEKRHTFHYENRGWFIIGIFMVLSWLTWAVLAILPKQVVIFAIVPGLFCISYFSSAISLKMLGRHGADRIPYVKNFIAGITFAIGTVVGVASFNAGDPFLIIQPLRLFFFPEVLCFSLLCILNITAIDVWRELRNTDDPDQSVLLESSLTLPLTLLALFSIYKTSFGQPSETWIFGGIFLSAAGLQLLHRTRRRFSPDLLRVLADVALLLPLPIFFLR